MYICVYVYCSTIGIMFMSSLLTLHSDVSCVTRDMNRGGDSPSPRGYKIVDKEIEIEIHV